MHLLSLLALIVIQVTLLDAKKHHVGKHKRCPISSDFSSSNSYSSHSSSSRSESPKFDPKCTSTLRNAVRVPDSCAYRYLQSVSNTLKAQSALLFTDRINTVIANFENTFSNILVTITSAFGEAVLYQADSTTIPVDPPKYSNTAKNYINFDGFVRAPESSQNFFYSFPVWDNEGRMQQITLSMPILDDPIFC